MGGAYRVALGMAYAGPSFERAIDELLGAGVSAIVVLPTFHFTVSFQSRFGRERWLGPATSDVLKELPAKGVKRPDPSRLVAL